jgi:uncharacterized heparinase superfamily protein
MRAHGSSRRLRYALWGQWYRTSLYRMVLAGRRPRQLVFTPRPLWPGDAGRGAKLAEGVYSFGGETVRRPGAALWSPAGASDRWLAALHGFEWLRDLRAASGEAPHVSAHQLLSRWLDTQDRWRAVPWRPDVLAARISSWLSYYDLMLEGADATLEGRFRASLARQVRHLRRVLAYVDDGAPRIAALKALILATLALPRERKRTRPWLEALVETLERQINPDGGQIERSPAVHFTVLRDLVEIRTALEESEAGIPPPLQTAIDRMAPMLRFFRHGDGGLVLFNDTTEDAPWLIDVMLTQADARGKPLQSAPHTGFERLSANRTLVVVDTGAPPPPGLDAHAHAGTLSFEMSIGRERLIVNCGAYRGIKDEWRIAQRTTAAHSTVTIDDVNSSDVLPGGGLGRRARILSSERRDSDGNCWIDASHDGYKRSCKLTHRRRLYLADSGGDFRGEDTLTGAGNHSFAVRFHLHPSVKASLVQGGKAALLRLNGGSGWRFRCSGGVIGLQESVYMGSPGAVKRTEQIVISGATEGGETRIKWAFTRLASSP